MKKIFEDLHKPTPRPEGISGPVEKVVAEAESRAKDLKLVDAAQLLDAALAQREDGNHQRARDQATLLAERGRIARLQLGYRQAAEFYAKAAEATEFDAAASWDYILEAADALSDQGEEFGDNQALSEAIAMYRSLVDDPASRARAPIDWAGAQHNLGNALERLGERESGTEQLEKAATAYRAARGVDP